MRQPSKLMKRALRRPRYNVTFMMTDPPDATQRVRIRAGDISIGESFSWMRDSDGDAIEVLGVDDDGLIVSGKLNEEQKERWKRIIG